MSSTFSPALTDWRHAGDPSAASLPRSFPSTYVKLAGLPTDEQVAKVVKASAEVFASAYSPKFIPTVSRDAHHGWFVRIQFSEHVGGGTVTHASGVVTAVCVLNGLEVC